MGYLPPAGRGDLWVQGSAPDGKDGRAWLNTSNGNLYAFDYTLGQWVPVGALSPMAAFGAFGLGRSSIDSGGNFATIVGENVAPAGFGDTAVGWHTDVTQGRGAAFGYQAAAGQNATALGSDATASGLQSIAIGNTAATAQGAVAIGAGSTAASSIFAVAIGQGAEASGDQSIAMGTSSEASGEQGVAIGNGTTATELQTIAIGAGGATALSIQAIKLGSGTAEGEASVAIGSGSETHAMHAVAIGAGSHGVHTGAIALGESVTTELAYQLAAGVDELKLFGPSGGAATIVIPSPDASLWRIGVSNAGALTVTAV